jgi:hypothetical protein
VTFNFYLFFIDDEVDKMILVGLNPSFAMNIQSFMETKVGMSYKPTIEVSNL